MKLLERCAFGGCALQLRIFTRDPRRSCGARGLSGEYKAMLDRDYAAVKRLSGLEDGKFATNHIILAYDED